MLLHLILVRLRDVGRWFRPAGFVLAGLFLLMPFIAVSCETPGGFGRAAPGGTTSYSGIDLMTGSSPEVSPADKVREGADERLDPQPLAMAGGLLIVAGMVITVVLQHQLLRRAIATTVAGAAAIFLLANQITVQSLLRARVREQITQPLPANKQIADYVQNESGFWLCLVTLIVLVMANGVGWLRSATRA
ncbi:MAG TPA: hypothetical protein DGG94_05830 [Micromonosporaceae bacterium]|nr:hypothetical protein [Micromonosporaceae bacterium]